MEMATGISMKSLPEPKDFSSAPKEVREVLNFIFGLQHSVEEVSSSGK